MRTTTGHADSGWPVGHRLRSLVAFACVNLADPLPDEHRFSIILFRNVSIYLSRKMRVQVCEGLTDLLEPEGMLLVGACDDIPLDSRLWKQEVQHGVRCFRRAQAQRRLPLRTAMSDSHHPAPPWL